MSSKGESQWDPVKFLTTLSYFGEIPFIGSFRWVQQLLGQSSAVPGVTMSAIRKKVVVVGDRSSQLFNRLQKQPLPTVDLIFYPHPVLTARTEPAPAATAELDQLLKTADTVVVLTPSALTLVTELSTYLRTVEIEQSVFDFSDGDISAWGALDDVVMGGVSQGNFFLRDQEAVFAGSVSTDNSGGFSSVRTQNFAPPFDLSGWTGLRLNVRGDGQRYKVILRNSDGWDSPGYIYSFETTADTQVAVDVPFDQLVPTFRARSLPDAPPFSPDRVFSFQLMLSKFEYDQQLNPQFTAGPFQLVVSSIGVYRPRQGMPLVAIAQDEADLEILRTALTNSPVEHQLIAPGSGNLIDAIIGALA